MTTKRKVIGYGYNHIEPGHPDNPTAYRICGARTKQELSNPVCTRPAGWGTSHAGAGRCKLHGGANLAGPDHGQYKTGRYAALFKGRLREHYENIINDGTDPLDLLPELEVQRTLLSLALEEIAQETNPDYSDKRDGFLKIDLDKRKQPGDVQLQGAQPADDEQDNSSRQAGDDSTPGTAGEEAGNNLPDDERKDDTFGLVHGGEYRESSLNLHQWEPSAPTPRTKFFSISGDQITRLNEITNGIVNLVTKVIAARNQTALTKAELIWLQGRMVELIDEYIPDVERRRSFIAKLRELLPGQPGGGEGGEGDGRDRLPAPGETSEAD